MLIEVAVVAPGILPAIVPPLAVMTGLMVVISFGLYLVGVGDTEQVPLDEAPSELKAAIVFGALYAAVLVAVAAAKEQFGTEGLYVVAARSGLTDMDAITLSTAQMIKKEQLDVHTGWRMILIGALFNLVFKAAAVAILGHRRLLLRIAIAFGIAVLGGVLVLLAWP